VAQRDTWLCGYDYRQSGERTRTADPRLRAQGYDGVL